MTIETEFQSDLPTIQVRCRGCDHVAVHGVMSLQGEDVAIRIRKESCPYCDGRMEELFLQRLGRSKFKPVFQ
jgi:formate dehydrogenase maturation protein FdhE